MATLVMLQKESESDKEAVYRFGPVGDPSGRLRIDKATGAIVKVNDVPGDTDELHYSAASRLLSSHFRLREFPAMSVFTL